MSSRPVFFRFLALFSGLALMAFTTIDSPKTTFNSGEPYRITITDPITGADYDIVLYKQEDSGESEIHVYQQGTENPPQDSMFFFVILPDGNYIHLGKDSKASSTSVGFSQKIKLQKVGSTTPLKVSDMQAYVLKKNDPNPPPKSLVANHQYKDVTVSELVESGDQDDIPIFGQSTADHYMSGDMTLKIGTSWSPWNDSDGYYFLIISYANRGLIERETVYGTVELNICNDPHGYTIDSIFHYNLDNTNAWGDSPVQTDPYSFNYIGLQNNEIRNIYFRLKKTGVMTNEVATYGATMTYSKDPTNALISAQSKSTDCQKIILGTSPHDPNKKIVDKNACTANGTGTLIYTITFQNEGDGPALDVLVSDVLPTEFAINNYDVNLLASSHPDKLLPTFQDAVNKQNLAFEFKNIYLPGSAQTSPVSYPYNETVGWVQFSCSATCPPDGESINNAAGIIFYDVNQQAQDTIHTDASSTVADTIFRPDWPVLINCPPCPETRWCCIGIGCRNRWCFGLTLHRKCRKPKTEKGVSTQ